jgi:hypothetical protein
MRCAELIRHAPDAPMAYAMLAQTCHAAGLTREATLNAFLASQRALQCDTPATSSRSRTSCSNSANGTWPTPRWGSSIRRIRTTRASLSKSVRLYSSLEDPAAGHGLPRARAREGVDNPRGEHVRHRSQLSRASSTGRWPLRRRACQAPCHGHAHWFRAQLGRNEGTHARVARMRAALSNTDSGTTTYLPCTTGCSRSSTHWAKTRRGLGVPDGRRAGAPQSHHARCRAGKRRCTTGLIQATSDCFFDVCGDVPRDATPIFVVGMPRTGTTLLERILGNHPQIKTCGELNDFRQQMQWANNQRLSLTLDPGIGDFVARLDPSVVGNRYLIKTEWAAERNGLYVDKHPMNFQWCGPILKALPHAKILHLRRHPLDSCFSNLKELFAHQYYPYSYQLDELATHYRNYARLMRHWHAIAPGRILDVRYEDLVSQPDVEARRVQAYLGLPEVEGVTDILANKTVTTTASTLQLRQPIHTRNVGGWRRYAQGLAPVQAMLADLIATTKLRMPSHFRVRPSPLISRARLLSGARLYLRKTKTPCRPAFAEPARRACAAPRGRAPLSGRYRSIPKPMPAELSSLLNAPPRLKDAWSPICLE